MRYFANSELYELFWITEHYSVKADLSADGDKWAWLSSPSPAEETVWLARAQGSGQCREGDTQWRGDLPNEQTCLRFEIMLSDTDSSTGTIRSRDIVPIQRQVYLCDLVLCAAPGLRNLGHQDNFSMTRSNCDPLLSCCQEQPG